MNQEAPEKTGGMGQEGELQEKRARGKPLVDRSLRLRRLCSGLTELAALMCDLHGSVQ